MVQAVMRYFCQHLASNTRSVSGWYRNSYCVKAGQ